MDDSCVKLASQRAETQNKTQKKCLSAERHSVQPPLHLMAEGKNRILSAFSHPQGAGGPHEGSGLHLHQYWGSNSQVLPGSLRETDDSNMQLPYM